MKSTTVALVAALVAPASGLQVVTRPPLMLVSAKTNTIGAVVKMLQTIMEKSKLEAEAERKEVALTQCTCDKDQGDAKVRITSLGLSIELSSYLISELKGDNGVRSSRVAELKSGLEENAVSREASQKTRLARKADFEKEQADLTGAIDQLDRAVNTLADVGADQTSSSSDHSAVMARQAFAELKSKVSKALSVVSSRIDVSKSSSIQSFLQSPSFGGNYAARSGGIFGILKDMRDTFNTNLKGLEETEAVEEKAATEFEITKSEEAAIMKVELEAEQSKLAENDDALSAKLEHLEMDTQMKLTTEVILADTEKHCEGRAKFFDERNLERTSSEAAISKAISILNSDDAFENFKGARASVSLLQVASSKKGHVFNVLFKRIAKVKAALDKEHDDDEAMMNWCNNKTDHHTASEMDLTSKIDAAKEDMISLNNQIEGPGVGHDAVIANTLHGLQESRDEQAGDRAGRVEEHKLYQEKSHDLSSSVKLIENALSVLAAHYDKADMQGVNADSSAAVDALKTIQTEFSSTLENEHKNEMKSQNVYEVTMSAHVALQAEMSSALTEEKAALHATKTNLKDRTSDKIAFTQQLEGEAKIFEEVDRKCQWVSENKVTRENNRAGERKALEQVLDKVRETPKFQADCAKMPNAPICQTS